MSLASFPIAIGKITLKSRRGPVSDRILKNRIPVVAELSPVRVRKG